MIQLPHRTKRYIESVQILSMDFMKLKEWFQSLVEPMSDKKSASNDVLIDTPSDTQ